MQVVRVAEEPPKIYPAVTEFQTGNAPEEVKTTQPVALIEVTQIAKKQHVRRAWSTGLFDCCSEFGNCAFAFFCPCIFQCTLMQTAGESCCAACCGGLVPLRTKIRTERGIEGSIVYDICSVACCPCCAMVQMQEEMKHYEALI